MLANKIQVPRQHTVAKRAVGIHSRLECVVGAEQGERGCGGEQLGVGGGRKAIGGVALVADD